MLLIKNKHFLLNKYTLIYSNTNLRATFTTYVLIIVLLKTLLLIKHKYFLLNEYKLTYSKTILCATLIFYNLNLSKILCIQVNL